MIKYVNILGMEGIQYIKKFDSRLKQFFIDNPTKIFKLYSTYVCEFKTKLIHESESLVQDGSMKPNDKDDERFKAKIKEIDEDLFKYGYKVDGKFSRYGYHDGLFYGFF
jgi:hypothetical protein